MTLAGGRVSWSVNEVRGGMGQWVRLKGGLGGLPAHMVVLCARIVQNPAFAPRTSEMTVGFWSFCISQN